MNDDKQELIRKEDEKSIKVALSPTHELDLSFLPVEQREILLKDYSQGMLDIALKAQELNVDSLALRQTLDNLAETTKDVAESGSAVTISHTADSKLGRTEVLMGNTDQAQSGKLTKSQTGERDWTPYYIFAAIVAIVLIAAFMNG